MASNNSLDYLCDECSNNNSPLTNEEKNFLSLFIESDKISDYKTHDDIFKNEKSEYLISQIYKISFIDNDLYNKLRKAFDKIQDAEYKCSKCGETVRNTFMRHSYDLYKMYKKIELVEIEDLVNQISKKSHINQGSLKKITNCDGFSQIWLLEECLRNIDFPLYDKYVTADKSLQWFNFDEKGGGESYSQLIEYLRVFIVSIVIPGLIWDFTKMGVLKFYQFLRNFRINEKFTNSINDKILEDEEELKKISNSLSKKEIKKLVKKEVKKQIKAITKECKKNKRR